MIAALESGVVSENETDDPVVDRIIEMYLEGRAEGKARYTVADIIEETGRSRTTIYYWLNRKGVKRNRQGITAGDTSELQPLLDRNDALSDENERLRAELEDVRSQLQRANALVDKFLGE